MSCLHSPVIIQPKHMAECTCLFFFVFLFFVFFFFFVSRDTPSHVQEKVYSKKKEFTSFSEGALCAGKHRKSLRLSPLFNNGGKVPLVFTNLNSIYLVSTETGKVYSIVTANQRRPRSTSTSAQSRQDPPCSLIRKG